MSQNINLFKAGAKSAKNWFSVKNLLIIYVVLLALLLMLYQSLSSKLTNLQQTQKQEQMAYEALQQRVEIMVADAQDEDKTKRLEAQRNQIKQKIDSQERIISTYRFALESAHLHIADYLADLSRQQVDGLWLTGFTVDVFKDDISLKGKAKTAELVPEYLRVLGQVRAFKDQIFGGLKLIESTQENERKAKEADTAPPQATQANTAQARNTPVPAVEVKLKPIRLIEFEVKGLDSKSGIDTGPIKATDNTVTKTTKDKDKDKDKDNANATSGTDAKAKG